eukprot:2741283-Pleurochrysis_carterae.AAC.1
MHASQQPVMRLHGIGDMEFPINGCDPPIRDAFAVFGTETDQKKSLVSCFESTAWLRTPQNLSELRFSF